MQLNFFLHAHIFVYWVFSLIVFVYKAIRFCKPKPSCPRSNFFPNTLLLFCGVFSDGQVMWIQPNKIVYLCSFIGWNQYICSNPFGLLWVMIFKACSLFFIHFPFVHTCWPKFISYNIASNSFTFWCWLRYWVFWWWVYGFSHTSGSIIGIVIFKCISLYRTSW